MFIKPSCLLLALLLATICSGEGNDHTPLLVQELTVEGTEGAKASVIYEAFLPDTARGYRIIDSEGATARANTLSRQGSKILMHINACPGEKLRLEVFDEIVRNTPAIHRNGLLRSAKPYSGKTISNLSEFRAEWLNGPSESIRVETQVFSGANPFGPNKNSLTMFNGFIDIAETGVYAFCTASSDASFLLIDNQIVAAAPGHHDVYSCLRGEHSGSIKLTKGTHPFCYCQANSRDDCFAIAAIYQSPKRMEVIPPAAFTPFLKATAKTIAGEEPPSWRHTGTIEYDSRQMREVTLGDGRKFYFYDNKLKRLGDYSIICDHDPAPMPMSQQAMNEMLMSAQKAAKDDPPTDEGCRFLSVALVNAGLEDQAEAFLKDTIAVGNLADNHAMRFCRTLLYDHFCAKEQYERAAECWRLLSENRGRQFSLEYARVLFYLLGKPDEAADVLDNVDIDSLPPVPKFRARLLSADLALQLKGYDAGASQYDQMTSREAIPENAADDGYDVVPGLAETSGAAMMAFVNSQRDGQPAEAMRHLERLEELQPQCRMDSELMTLKYRLAARMNRPKYAYLLADKVLRLRPSPATAAAALLYMAQNRVGANDKAQARVLLRRILAEYPETAAAIQAEKLLAEL